MCMCTVCGCVQAQHHHHHRMCIYRERRSYNVILYDEWWWLLCFLLSSFLCVCVSILYYLRVWWTWVRVRDLYVSFLYDDAAVVAFLLLRVSINIMIMRYFYFTLAYPNTHIYIYTYNSQTKQKLERTACISWFAYFIIIVVRQWDRKKTS